MTESNSFCPYVGLQPYTESERDYFFARERDIRIITSNLYAAPLTVLYGASGVGKSSVLLAGVVPRLRASPRTAVVIFRQWQHSSSLNALKSECIKVIESVDGKRLNIDESLPLDELLFAAGKEFNGSIILLLDQFEEYFLYHPRSQVEKTFDEEFARTVNREEIDAAFLIALREDALSKMDRFRARIPNLLGNVLRLRHLDLETAKEAICKPLEVYSTHYPAVTADDELVEQVLQQVRTGQVALDRAGGVGKAQSANDDVRVETPFLQLVMTRLWDAEMAQGSRMLRASTLHNLGGAKTIVRTHLDSVMGRLNPEGQAIASQFFDRIVTPSGTKIAQTSEDLVEYVGRPAAQVMPVLKTLADTRVLRMVAPPLDQPAADRYEIFHDVLAPAILDWRRRFVEKEERERIRAHERARIKRLWVSLLVAGLLVVLFGALSVFAFRESIAAKEAEKISSSRELAALSISSLQSDPQLGALLAIEADRYSHTYQAEDALRQAIRSLPMFVLNGHTDEVESASFSPDGKLILTAGADATVRIWDAMDGHQVNVLRTNGVGINGAMFSPDGKEIVTANADATAIVWDVATGRQMTILRGHSNSVKSVAFSSNSKQIVTASGDKTARIWDAATGRELRIFRGHSDVVNGAAFSTNGNQIATASKDKSAIIWDVETGRQLKVLNTHTGVVNSVAFSPDGKQILTASGDRTAIVWDVATGRQLTVLRGHTGPLNGAAFSGDGQRIVTASGDKTAAIWDSSTGRELDVFHGHTDVVNSAAFSPDGKQIITAGNDTRVAVWDIGGGREVALFNGHARGVNSVAFSSDGAKVVSSSADGTARIWQVTTARQEMVLQGHSSFVNSAVFNRDGTRVLTGSSDNTARLWDVANGNQLMVFAGHTGEIFDARFSPNENQIVTASTDKTGRIWDVASGREVMRLTGHTDAVNTAAFSPDGKHIITSSRDKTARIWDAATGNQLNILLHDPNVVNDAAYSPDGKLIVTASKDQTSRLWDATDEREVAVLQGHTGPVQNAAFSADGKLLVTSSSDRTARLWDMATNREITVLRGHTDALNSVAVSPDGKFVATASKDGTARIYYTNIEDVLAAMQTRLTRGFTCEEKEKYLNENITCPTPTPEISELPTATP